MSPFREIAVLTPHSQNRQPAYRARKRHSTVRLRTDARPIHATVPSSSGPVRKHTAKFEPAAWSWAQMTSGSGAPKRVLSDTVGRRSWIGFESFGFDPFGAPRKLLHLNRVFI